MNLFSFFHSKKRFWEAYKTSLIYDYKISLDTLLKIDESTENIINILSKENATFYKRPDYIPYELHVLALITKFLDKNYKSIDILETDIAISNTLKYGFEKFKIDKSIVHIIKSMDQIFDKKGKKAFIIKNEKSICPTTIKKLKTIIYLPLTKEEI